jgi:hypothetical protein
MVAAIIVQADAEGHYTAGSMYQAWKEWSFADKKRPFADKKRPSPWLTFLEQRIRQRAGGLTAVTQ